VNKTKILLALKSISWIGMIVLFIVISIAAVEKRNNSRCQNLKIRFKNDENLGFIDSRDILEEVNQADPSWKGQKLSKVKFNLIENGVKQNEYVKKAELYLDNQENINVVLIPKKPIARINSVYESYYLSEDWDRMGLSSKFSKRIVHVSGRIEKLTNPETKMDSLIKNSLTRIVSYMNSNPIWRDAIEQIYFNENGKVDLVLSFSEPTIRIGYIDENFEKRMKKVDHFFKTVVRCHDLTNYEELDFQYSQQVVARKKYGVN
jgi:cell division protein FtsQ